MNNIFSSDVKIIINLIIFGILSIFPYTKFIKCKCIKLPKQMLLNTANYEDVYFSFYNDYQRQNPFTKRLGLTNYLKALKDKGYLSKNAFDTAIANIDQLNLLIILIRYKLF